MSPAHRLTALIFVACLGIFGGGVLMEVVGSLPVCILCKVERFFFLAGAVLAGLAWFFTMPRLIMLMRVLAGVWFVGAGVASYHTAVQYRWVSTPKFCQVQEPEGETLEEMVENLRKTRYASCDQITLAFLGIPAPVYLVVLMNLLGMVCWNIRLVGLYVFRRCSRSGV